MWSPDVYLQFSDERGRPYQDLISRVQDDSLREIVDVGCGPGNLLPELTRRWPGASIRGFDSSPEMIDAARQRGGPYTYEVRDARDYTPSRTTDAVITNAMLQWIPGHEQLLTRWAGALRPGAWLALQVPGNQYAHAHELLRELYGEPRWQAQLAGIAEAIRVVLDAAGYAQLLRRAGCAVDAWETTYLHQLPADAAVHPVLTWLTGTALRPVRATLNDQDWAAFQSDLEPRLAEAYPAEADVVDFSFRRVFAVARRR